MAQKKERFKKKKKELQIEKNDSAHLQAVDMMIVVMIPFRKDHLQAFVCLCVRVRVWFFLTARTVKSGIILKRLKLSPLF